MAGCDSDTMFNNYCDWDSNAIGGIQFERVAIGTSGNYGCQSPDSCPRCITDSTTTTAPDTTAADTTTIDTISIDTTAMDTTTMDTTSIDTTTIDMSTTSASTNCAQNQAYAFITDDCYLAC